MTRLRNFINVMMALTMIALAIFSFSWQKANSSSEMLYSVSLLFSFIGGIFLWVNMSTAPSEPFRMFYALGALVLNVITILMIVLFINQGIPWIIIGITFGVIALFALAISYFAS